MKVYIGPYPESDEERTIDVEIHDSDTVNLDQTLAFIILPALRKFKEDTMGVPYVHDEDVPEDLQTDIDYDEQSLDFLERRWNYVMDEMIWTFEQITGDADGEFAYFYDPDDLDIMNIDKNSLTKYGANHVVDTTFYVDEKGLEEYHRRIENGLKLFGKYYRALWS